MFKFFNNLKRKITNLPFFRSIRRKRINTKATKEVKEITTITNQKPISQETRREIDNFIYEVQESPYVIPILLSTKNKIKRYTGSSKKQEDELISDIAQTTNKIQNGEVEINSDEIDELEEYKTIAVMVREFNSSKGRINNMTDELWRRFEELKSILPEIVRKGR